MGHSDFYSKSLNGRVYNIEFAVIPPTILMQILLVRDRGSYKLQAKKYISNQTNK